MIIFRKRNEFLRIGQIILTTHTIYGTVSCTVNILLDWTARRIEYVIIKNQPP